MDDYDPFDYHRLTNEPRDRPLVRKPAQTPNVVELHVYPDLFAELPKENENEG